MDFGDYFTRQEIAKIIKEQTGLTHPLIELIEESYDSSGYHNYVKSNTVTAFQRVKLSNQQWLLKKRKNVLEKDRFNASAALGEFRCYSALIDTFGKNIVKPISETDTPTPDFMLDYNGDNIYIEVNTVQMNNEEAKRLSDFNRKGQGEVIREICYCPFGNKSGYSTTQTVIRKIYNVKTDSLQIQKGKINILWIDLQDGYMRTICDKIDRFAPIISGRHIGGAIEGFYSNELWYALYSTKGLAVFEGETMNAEEGKEHSLGKIGYDGKFANDEYSYINAVIYAGTKSVIICENPYAQTTLPDWFLKKITEMQGFRVESAIFNFMKNDITLKIQNDLKYVEELSKNTFYSW